jgi:glucokinase
MELIAAVDVGGHNIRSALTDSSGKILGRLNQKTDRTATNAETNLQLVLSTVDDLLAESNHSLSQLRCVAIGLPGQVDTQKGLLFSAPNIPHWEDLQVRDWFQSKLDAPVLLNNDVNMAVLGEYWKGAAQGCRNFFFIGLGTGIGGGVFINGKLLEGSRFGAGEIGYLVLAPGQENRRMGDLGWFESVASGLALDLAGREAARLHPTSILNSIKSDSSLVTSKDVFSAAAQGDEIARRIVESAVEYIALAVVNITAIIDPEVIVFGGGMSSQGEELLEPVRDKASIYGLEIPPLRRSELGDDAQLLGAIYSGISLQS